MKDIFPWNQEAYARLLATRARSHHALLLVGPAGVGKSGLALALARARLCEQPAADGAACGRCKACGWFDAGNHPDFRLVRPASAEDRDEAEVDPEPSAPRSSAGRSSKKPSREIRIEQVRALDPFLDVGAHRGGQRVIVVDPADAMNTIAANALLKRLEEPPPGTGFILVASRPSALPATIRSRCQHVALPLPAAGEASAWLAGRAGVSIGQAAGWLAAAAGAPLLALRFATEDDAAAHQRVVAAFAAMPEAGIVATADALAGIEPTGWSGVAQSWATDLARVRAGAAPRRHLGQDERLRLLAARSSLARLMALEQRLRALPREAAHPLNPRLLLEDVLLDYHRALA